MSEEPPIPIQPLDDDDKRRREIYEDAEALGELQAHRDKRGEIPLEHRENLSIDDVEHFVINFCLDHFNGKIDRLQTHIRQLRRYPDVGLAAIDAYLNGERAEPAMKNIPPRLRRHFLLELRKAVQI